MKGVREREENRKKKGTQAEGRKVVCVRGRGDKKKAVRGERKR